MEKEPVSGCHFLNYIQSVRSWRVTKDGKYVGQSRFYNQAVDLAIAIHGKKALVRRLNKDEIAAIEHAALIREAARKLSTAELERLVELSKQKLKRK